jgi:hypothetical protein
VDDRIKRMEKLRAYADLNGDRREFFGHWPPSLYTTRRGIMHLKTAFTS